MVLIITKVSATVEKSDDITSIDAVGYDQILGGAINLTPATGSAVVLDGSVNVDGGAKWCHYDYCIWCDHQMVVLRMVPTMKMEQ